VTVQVCAVVLQPMPFLQSVSAAHWTQVPPLQTGVEGGQFAFPVHPVEATQTLLLLHTWPPGQSVLAMHCTHLGNGLTRQTGVAAGQSCTWVATVQTGLHASLTQLYPCAHCVVAVHCTHEPVPVSQCGVCGSEVQSLSDVHLVETQVFCGEQVSPGAQSDGCTHATQVLFLHAGVGGLQAAQPLAATQV